MVKRFERRGFNPLLSFRKNVREVDLSCALGENVILVHGDILRYTLISLMNLLPRSCTSALHLVGTEVAGTGLMLESMLPSRIEMPPILDIR